MERESWAWLSGKVLNCLSPGVQYLRTHEKERRVSQRVEKGEKPRGKRKMEEEEGKRMEEKWERKRGQWEREQLRRLQFGGKRNKEGVKQEEQRSSLHSKNPGNSGQFDFGCPAKRSTSREKVDMVGTTVRHKTIFLWVGAGGLCS